MDQLGPFQKMARNFGIQKEIVEKLPSEWPSGSDHNHIADALYEAGYPAGDELIAMARKLWKNRPFYRK